MFLKLFDLTTEVRLRKMKQMTSLIQNRCIYSVLSCDYYMIFHVTIVWFVMWLLYDFPFDY